MESFDVDSAGFLGRYVVHDRGSVMDGTSVRSSSSFPAPGRLQQPGRGGYMGRHHHHYQQQQQQQQQRVVSPRGVHPKGSGRAGGHAWSGRVLFVKAEGQEGYSGPIVLSQMGSQTHTLRWSSGLVDGAWRGSGMFSTGMFARWVGSGWGDV